MTFFGSSIRQYCSNHYRHKGQCALTSDTIPKPRTFTCQDQALIFARELFFATIVNGLSVLKLVQILNGDLNFLVAVLQHLQTLCLVRISRISKLGQVFEVRAYYHHDNSQVIKVYYLCYSSWYYYRKSCFRTNGNHAMIS